MTKYLKTFTECTATEKFRDRDSKKNIQRETTVWICNIKREAAVSVRPATSRKHLFGAVQPQKLCHLLGNLCFGCFAIF